MDLIVIPSSGRAKRQQSLFALQKTGITESYKTVVAVYHDEVNQYRRMSYKGKRIKGIELAIVPEEYRGIARKREWILTKLAKKHDAKFVAMIDDDLSFCYRPKIAKPDMPYINTDQYQMHRMVETLTTWLEDGFMHVGLISRQANRNTGIRWLEPGRAMNVHAFNSRYIRKLVNAGQLEFGRLKVMEDFDLTLQLLELGYPNRISCRYAWTTTSSLEGGCSVYRTEEVQAKAAKKLARLHPEYVRLVTKKAKTWKTGLNERIDVQIQWKKAYEAGSPPF
jgi:hypothetical protein